MCLFVYTVCMSVQYTRIYRNQCTICCKVLIKLRALQVCVCTNVPVPNRYTLAPLELKENIHSMPVGSL